MNIWIEINKLTGQTLRTLDQRRPFDVVDVNEHAVIVRPHKNEIERYISREAIENAYRRLVVAGEITRTEIHSEFSEFNPAYVVAILAALPNVQHSIRPIRLWIIGKN
jgi:hypothetical protein